MLRNFLFFFFVISSSAFAHNSATYLPLGDGKISTSAKQDGPWSPKGITDKDPRAVLKKVAQELKVDKRELAESVGPPPPNFYRASKRLRISEDKLSEAFDRARQSN